MTITFMSLTSPDGGNPLALIVETLWPDVVIGAGGRYRPAWDSAIAAGTKLYAA